MAATVPHSFNGESRGSNLEPFQRVDLEVVNLGKGLFNNYFCQPHARRRIVKMTTEKQFLNGISGVERRHVLGVTFPL